ncbi:MAG TPA: hypothetical protein VFA18_22420 [Gemmataceae bacterium]|nr:hypothetical protein [Gemmataceae bacterium]
MGTRLRVKTWLDSVERLEPGFRDSMLVEAAAHTSFQPPLPSELSFLTGRFVDMGFENLGLGPQKFNDLLRAFSGTGVAVPHTSWRLRFTYPYAVVEPAVGSEQQTLPDWWKEAVLVTDDQFKPTWVGKRVRPDQTAGFNLQGYRDVGEGMVPP